VRLYRLGPVQARRSDVIAKGNRCHPRNGNRVDAGNEALRRQGRKGVKLILSRRTVGNAGVLVNILEGREYPELIPADRASLREYVILPRERLLGIRGGILDGVTGIESGRAIVKRAVPVPFIGSPPGGDHHRAASCPARVCILVRRAHGK